MGTSKARQAKGKGSDMANGKVSETDALNPFIANGKPTNSAMYPMVRSWLETVNAIREFNAQYYAPPAPEGEDRWTFNKLLAVAKEKREVNPEFAALVERWEDLWASMGDLRKEIATTVGKAIGVEVAVEPPKPPEDQVEALKELRKAATAVGNTLAQISAMPYMDSDTINGITRVLTEQPLPGVMSAKNWSPLVETAPSAPRYHVDVVVTNSDGKVVLERSGFVQAAQYGRKLHENKDNAPDAGTLRKAFEDANKEETAYQTEDGYTYTIKPRK